MVKLNLMRREFGGAEQLAEDESGEPGFREGAAAISRNLSLACRLSLTRASFYGLTALRLPYRRPDTGRGRGVASGGAGTRKCQRSVATRASSTSLVLRRPLLLQSPGAPMRCPGKPAVRACIGSGS